MKTKVLAVVAVIALSACPGGSIPQDQFQNEEMKAVCKAYTACGAFSSEAACNSFFQNVLGSLPNPYDSRVKSGKVTYDGARAKACVDSVSKIQCGASLFAPLPDCQVVYQGTVKLGEVCTNTVECTSDAYCKVASGSQCSGVCAARIPLGGDATMGGTCAQNLVVVDGKCQMPLGAGAMCMGAAFNCDAAQNLYCGSSQVCQKAHLEGETCDDMQQCGGLLTCSAGHCNRYLPVGSSCATVNNVTPQCQIDLHCDTGNTTCTGPGAAGASCTSDTDCVTGLKCATVSRKCAMPVGVNQSCLAAPCDDSTYCETLTSVCKQRIADGQACTQFNSCASKYSFCQGGMCTNSSCL